MPSPAGPHLDRLAAVFGRLRAPGGCPWDRDRSLADLGRYLREECGDLLANLVFTVEIARERGWFDIEAVTRGACEKIVRRHPHVFGDAKASTSAEVEVLWNRIKAEERAGAVKASKGKARTMVRTKPKTKSTRTKVVRP